MFTTQTGNSRRMKSQDKRFSELSSADMRKQSRVSASVSYDRFIRWLEATIKIQILIILLCLSFSGTGIAGQSATKGPSLLAIGEAQFMEIAINKPMPVYPPESAKKGAGGIVIARVYADEKGNVSKVNLLRASDSPINDAVISTLKQWTIKPPTIGGKPQAIFTKVTFSFDVENKKVRVILPEVKKQ